MTIRVLLCDDQELVTDGIQLILETDSAIKVVGVARDGVQAIELVSKLQPDIVLMDLKMPEMTGVHATRIIHRDHPRIPVLVLTTFDGDDWVMDAIRSGAAGYLLKDTPRERLISAVKDTVNGRAHVDPAVTARLLSHLAESASASHVSTLSDSLNDRELEILKLMTHGLVYSEIAKRMSFSEGTVRNYASAIFAKLGVADRMQAVVLAMRYGLVSDTSR